MNSSPHPFKLSPSYSSASYSAYSYSYSSSSSSSMTVLVYRLFPSSSLSSSSSMSSPTYSSTTALLGGLPLGLLCLTTALEASLLSSVVPSSPPPPSSLRVLSSTDDCSSYESLSAITRLELVGGRPHLPGVAVFSGDNLAFLGGRPRRGVSWGPARASRERDFSGEAEESCWVRLVGGRPRLLDLGIGDDITGLSMNLSSTLLLTYSWRQARASLRTRTL